MMPGVPGRKICKRGFHAIAKLKAKEKDSDVESSDQHP